MHWKLSSKARIASDFSTLLRIKQGEKRKRCHPKSDFRLWQATYFSTKNPINKLAMNNRRLLIAAEFHFVHPVEKDSYKHYKLTQNSVSFSCQRKQVSRCCKKFPREHTCQILTNQSIKSVIIKVSTANWKKRNCKWSDKSFRIGPLTDRQVTLLVKILSIREVVFDVMWVGFGIMG